MVLVVVFCGRISLALLGEDMHDDRRPEITGSAQRPFHRCHVMPIDRPDIFQPQVFKHHLRLNSVLEALFERVQRVVQRWADHRGPVDRVFRGRQHLLVAAGHTQVSEMLGEPADRRRIGAAVVVDDDDDPGGFFLRRCC